MSGRVLLIDDDISTANLLKAQLTQANYEVRIALTGVSAMQTFQEACPDLVVLDIMHSQVHSNEVCKSLRLIPEATDVPIIMLAGGNSLECMQDSFAAGVDDYLTKPFRQEELILRVKSHIDRVQRIKAAHSAKSAVKAVDPSEHTSRPFNLDNPTISVVIPTLNEAENLPFVMPRIPKWVNEIIIVDGRSTDNTVKVAKELCPNVKIVMEPRRGKGSALQAGFAAASGDIIVMIDADGSNDPQEIPAFVGALLAGADFAKGTRFAQGGGTSDMPLIRRLANLAFVLIVRALFGGTYTDLCYGYNAFWAHALPKLNLDTDGFEIETSMNIHALNAKLKITEIPSFEASRLFGIAKLRAFPDGWRVLKTIGTELWRKLWPTAHLRTVLSEDSITMPRGLASEHPAHIEDLGALEKVAKNV